MTTDNQKTDISDKTIEAGDLGKLLKEYRNIAHLDIDQVADSLCLTPSTLHALENEEFSKLPESPYVRGYLRNYARLADKNPQHLITIYNTLRGEISDDDNNLTGILSGSNTYQEVSNPLITPHRFRLALLAGLLLLLGLLTMIPGVKEWTTGIWNNFSISSETTTVEDVSETSLSLPSLTGDVPGNLPISPDEAETDKSSTDTDEETSTSADENNQDAEANENNTSDKTANSNTDTKTEKTTEEKSDDNDQQTSDADSVAKEDATTKMEGDTHLKLVFSDEVWLRIKGADGAVLYEALHPAGTEKELSFNKPLKFKVGNAPGLKLFVNGKEMDTSAYTKGSVAKFPVE